MGQLLARPHSPLFIRTNPLRTGPIIEIHFPETSSIIDGVLSQVNRIQIGERVLRK